jgi:hypothetical protein
MAALAGDKEMNELLFDYGVRSDLSARPEWPAAHGAKLPNTLDAVSHTDPVISPGD